MFGHRRRQQEYDACIRVAALVVAVVVEQEKTKRKALEVVKEIPKLEAPRSKQIMSFVKDIQNG